MKELLSQAGVSFTTCVIDEDVTAYDELIARGWRTIPVTVFDDRVVKGFDVAALQQAIAASRTRS